MLDDDLVSIDHRRLVASPTLTKADVRRFVATFVRESTGPPAPPA